MSRHTTPGPPPATATLADLERRAADRAAPRHHDDDALIVCDRLVRIFSAEGVEVQALQGLDLLVRRGELTAIVGASGSGKSTLLTILAGLDTPSAGSATVAGYDLLAMDARTRLRYRRETVGFIWQRTSHNLLPYLSAVQNVALPMKLRGRGGPVRGRDRTRRALELLDLLGIADRRDHRPDQLSGGEQQRVAIAVALANNPSVVFADEPTGELDSTTAADVFAALRHANAELGTTILVVTHDNSVAGQVSRTVSIRDGRTSTETLRSTAHDEQGKTSTVSREYTTIDRSGRLQLPTEFTRPLDIRDRVLLELRPDHIEVRPGQDADTPDSPRDDAADSTRDDAADGTRDDAPEDTTDDTPDKD
ncbi:ATP-binding cassette domain-containing protein [Streptomyces cacaoi]|uniref:ABC transporter ATP-binding protein n=1 Tax=Streptomyces cacaoi TaxID=1898 RepID=A0A4Y3R4T2_STRCI|nr:ATP-binding cassette domain-containing protein [Streptomyces cacaoi]NNG84160.1 ATP-binding cassette domain-containing protein [Streptomyces cacaoi]GEB50960.1 ABC transporter ATP-binding protein [Streptomyces cacaoi]